MVRPLLKHALFALTLMAFLAPAAARAQKLTVQGRISRADGTAVNGAATKFRVQVFSADPAKHCIIYDETHTEDMSDSKGLFSVNLGDVNPSRIHRDAPTTYSLAEAFANRGSLSISGSYCSPVLGGTVTIPLSPGDNRKMLIQFNDPSSMGSAWETIPEMEVNYVAYAMDAQNVSGFPASSLVRVVDGSGAPQSFNALTSGEATELGLLVAGNSNRYVGKGGTAGVQLPSGAPMSPAAGSVWFESGSLRYSDGVNPPYTLGTSTGGTITGVTASTGLMGGGTTGTVSLALAPSGVGAGSTKGSATLVPKITYDTYGRITGVVEEAITGTVPNAGADGQVLKASGGSWTSASARTSDLKSTSDEGSIFPAVTCTASETMYWNSGTDKFACQGIALGAPSATVVASYKLVTVAADGRVNGGSSPTTLSGFGITDALSNQNGVTNLAAGNTAGRPSPSVLLAGRLYIDTQALTLYRDNGSTWDIIGTAGAGGSLTGVTAGAGLAGGGSSGNVTVSLDTTGVVAVTNATKVTTDAYGRVTSSGSLAAGDIPSLDWSKITTGKPTDLAGYGIVKNYVENYGSAVSLSAGNTAGRPGTPYVAGRIYIDTQANTVSYDTGSAWQTITSGGGFTGSLGGEVSGAQGSTQVDSINGVNRSTITSNLNAVTAATDAATNSTLVKRDSSGGFSVTELRLKDGTTNTVALKAAGTSAAYSLQFPAVAPAPGQSLQSDGSGVLSWVTAAAGSLTDIIAGTGIGVTGSGATRTVSLTNTLGSAATNIGSATAVPTISVDQQGRITAISSTTIPGVAPGGAASGDLGNNYPGPKVVGLQTTPISSTAPGLGQVLKYVSSNWAASTLDLNDLKQNDGTTSAVANAGSVDCTASKVMYYDTSTKSLRCQNASIAASTQITGILPVANGGTGVDASSITQNFVFAAPTGGAGAPTFRALAASDLPASASYWTSATGGINYAGGNVGINTTNPQGRLESVYSKNRYVRLNDQTETGSYAAGTRSTFRSDDNGAPAILNFENRDVTAAILHGANIVTRFSYTGGANAPISATSINATKEQEWTSTASTQNSKLEFLTAASGSLATRMTIRSDGSVGIGTTSPGAKLDVKGGLRLSGATSGYVGLQPAAVAGSTTYTLPSADGTGGYVLSTNGSGTLSWIANTAGSITGVNADTGLTSSTTSGVTTIGLGTELAAINGLGTTGFVKRTGAGAYTTAQPNLTSDVTGVLPLANGGTNANLTAVNGGVAYSTASAMAFSAAGTSGQILRSAGAAAPTWSTATFPSTAAIGDLLYASSANTWASLAKANTAALVTSSTGVPSWATGATANRLLRTDGTSVSFAQANLTTDVTGTLPIANGGTGATSTSQSYVFAGPTSGSGAPAFRALAAGDLPASASYWTAATGGINYASGSVGIGTTTPSGKFHVHGGDWTGITLTNANNADAIGSLKYDPLSAYVSGKSFLILSDETTNTNTRNGGIMFRTNNGATGASTAPAMTIRETGYIGIGTTAPGTLVDVVGTQAVMRIAGTGATSGSGEPSIILQTTNTGGPTSWSMRAGSNNSLQNLRIGTTGTQDMMNFTTGGNVGIGTTAPVDQLQLGTAMAFHNSGHKVIGFGYAPGTTKALMAGNPAELRWDPAGGLSMGVDATARATGDTVAVPATQLYLKSNGNVGVGTASPNQKLSVAGTIETTSGGVKFPDGSVQTKASQVLNTYFVTTGTTMQTINSTTPVAVTGLSVTLTPASTSSRFIITAIVNGSMTYVASSLVYRNGSSILNHANNSNAAGAMATTFATDSPSTAPSLMRQHHINYVDSPNTTASITYDIRHVSAWGGTAYTTYVNDRSGGDMRTPSTLMITELSN